MNRKGLSFSLTLVIVGVVLLMTALSVITLSGSSLTKWFNTVGGERDSTVQEADIRQACSQLAQEINQQYCDQYIGYEYTGSTGSCEDAAGNEYNLCGSGYKENDDPYNPEKWSNQPQCGNWQPQSTPKTERTANTSQASPPLAYSSTATDAGCTWAARGGIDALSGFNNEPIVEVETGEGDMRQFNCLNRGYFATETCPAQ